MVSWFTKCSPHQKKTIPRPCLAGAGPSSAVATAACHALEAAAPHSSAVYFDAVALDAGAWLMATRGMAARMSLAPSAATASASAAPAAAASSSDDALRWTWRYCLVREHVRACVGGGADERQKPRQRQAEAGRERGGEGLRGG